jgi:hypothetical protein
LPERLAMLTHAALHSSSNMRDPSHAEFSATALAQTRHTR